jgi:hypothetical protein
MKELLIIFGFTPVITLTYALFHLIKSIIYLDAYLKNLKDSVYKHWLFILGPFLLLSEKFSDNSSWTYRNSFLYHFYRSIIAIALTLLIIFVMKMAVR